MTVEADSAETGALSVDDATALLDGAPRKDEDQADAAPDDGAPAEADDGADPEAPAAEDGGEDGDDEPDEDLPAIEPPTSWDAEAKAVFAQLPRDAQEVIRAREAQRDAFVNQANERAIATARKAVEAEVAQIKQRAAVLDQLVPQAMETFRGRWEGIDWARWAQENPVQCFQAEKRCAAEQAQLQQLRAAQQESQQESYRQFVETEAAKLPELVPDLADPEHGEQRKQALAEWLRGAGVADQELAHASASHLAIAYDAMRWRRLEARARAELAKPKNPTPAGKPLKPAAAQGGSTQQRSATVAKNRFAQTRSVEDAVAMLNARG